ncbi:MAG: sugar phosphate isomerase/epimerase [Sphingomonas sp.]
MLDRRMFLGAAGAAVGSALLPISAGAMPLGLPPGLQLWTVKEDLAKDFAGTLKSLKAIGYDRVEAAGWVGLSPADFRKGVAAAGLDCFSCHYSMMELMGEVDTRLAAARDVGVRYFVASSPAWRKPLPPGRPWVQAVAEAMTLDDWRRNAARMNEVGARAAALGMRFAYHNHPAEFLAYDGKVAFHELLEHTDPALVAFELDLGWVAAAGYDPAHVLKEHGARIELLHVKDIATKERKPGTIAGDLTTVPIGKGSIDWPTVFAAAKAARIKSWFVEQEAPWVQPQLTALTDSIAYLRTLPA